MSAGRTVSFLLAAVFVAGCGGDDRSAGGAEPACAGPVARVAEPTVAPGDTLRVSADYLVDGCYDQGEGLRAEPLDDQSVTWRQGADEIELAVFDAEGATGRVDVTVTVPAQAKPGDAAVTVGRSAPAEVTVAP